MKTYFVAVVESESRGGWHILDEFEAANNSQAEVYAQANFPDREWYVLDEQKRNINAW